MVAPQATIERGLSLRCTGGAYGIAEQPNGNSQNPPTRNLLQMQEVRDALKRQHHAAMAMFRQAIDNCPDDVWISGEHPRNYWRIAYHALAYAHLYLYEDLASWKKWPGHIQENAYLDGDDVPANEPYTKDELLAVIDLIDSEIDSRIDALDLSSPTCGFTWYPKVSRVELLILSLRHIHGHLGQLHEILIANDEDIEWLGQIK